MTQNPQFFCPLAPAFSWRNLRFQTLWKLGVVAFALLINSGSASAAVTLLANDASGTSSITGSTNWSNGQSPGAANDYVVGSGLILRTPADNQTYTFAGNSLTLAGTFDFKQTNIITVANLQLTNGTLLNAFAGGPTNAGRIAGTINIVTNSAIDNGGNVGGILSMQILGTLTGSGGLTVKRPQMTIFSGTNTYSGPLILQGTTLLIDGTGSIRPSSLTMQNYAVSGSQTNSFVTNIVAAGGSLNVGYGSSGLLRVGYRASAGTNCVAMLDISSQPLFTLNVGEFSVGYNNFNDSLTTVGTVFLATNNNITATNLFIGDSAFTGGGISAMTLGSGSNYFNVPTMTVGARKATGTMTLPADGVLQLSNGAGRSELTVGGENFNTSVSDSGTIDLSGGNFIASLDALIIGQKLGGGTGGTGGTLILSGSAANNINANTLLIGNLAGATSGSPLAQGTLTFGGGNFLVNSNVTLAGFDHGSGSASGTLNLNGGIFAVGGNIVSGGGSSIINLNAGMLIASNSVGTAAVPIAKFSMTNATLQIATAAVNSTNVTVSTLNVGGAVNVIQITSASTNSYQSTIPLISYANYNGAVNFTPDFTALSNAYPALSFTGTITTTNNTVVLNLTVHHAPVANPDTFNRTAGLTLKILMAELLTNDVDADGNAITLSVINLTTTNGINLQTNASYIYYTNSLNVNDQFSYVITDGYLSATGLVSIVVSTNNITGQPTGNVTVANNMATVGFAGIPGYTYEVQRSTNLVDWTTIWTTNAPDGGLFNYTDNFGDLGGTIPSSAYYRLGWVP